ncbi:MAG: hypothetical protein ACHQT8_06155 [Chlamydiales bacterium]
MRKQDVPSRSFLARNWWVILFFGLCYLIYSHGMHKKKATLSELQGRYSELEAEKLVLVEQQNELRMQVRSQGDPAWVEMTLVKALGLVPDGQRKVYFETQD